MEKNFEIKSKVENTKDLNNICESEKNPEMKKLFEGLVGGISTNLERVKNNYDNKAFDVAEMKIEQLEFSKENEDEAISIFSQYLSKSVA